MHILFFKKTQNICKVDRTLISYPILYIDNELIWSLQLFKYFEKCVMYITMEYGIWNHINYSLIFIRIGVLNF